MISWGKFLAGLVALLNRVTAALERRSLIRTGRALERGETAREQLERVRKAQQAAQDVRDPDSAVAERVRQFDRD